jgi:hypothetical protein
VLAQAQSWWVEKSIGTQSRRATVTGHLPKSEDESHGGKIKAHDD